MKSNTSPLGEWIRQGLTEIGRNQVWLAEKVGVQAPQISRIINGGSETMPDLLIAIADALGKPRIQAFRAAGYLEQPSKEDEWVELMDYKIKRLQPSLRGVAERFINSMLEGEEEPKPKAKSKPKPRSSTL